MASKAKPKKKQKTQIDVSALKKQDPRLVEYEALSKDNFVLYRLADRLAPKIIGADLVKRAIVLALVSVDDAQSVRGRLHLLLHGPPGSAKSSLIEAAAKVADLEVLSSRTSPGSLTVDFRNYKEGAFAAAHHSDFQCLFVDEFEKVPRDSLKHFLRAMEEGEIAIPSGEAYGGTHLMRTHWRLFATANTLEGLAPELLDRFDFKVLVTRPDKPQARRIVEGIAAGFMRAGAPLSESADVPKESVLDNQLFLRGYVKWARSYVPEFPDEERQHAARLFQRMVDAFLPGEYSMRSFESVLRCAYALARIRRVPVTVERIVEAVDIVHPGRHWERLLAATLDAVEMLRARRAKLERITGGARSKLAAA
jgi:replicative DNA helicase Mcm